MLARCAAWAVALLSLTSLEAVRVDEDGEIEGDALQAENPEQKASKAIEAKKRAEFEVTVAKQKLAAAEHVLQNDKKGEQLANFQMTSAADDQNQAEQRVEEFAAEAEVAAEQSELSSSTLKRAVEERKGKLKQVAKDSLDAAKKNALQATAEKKKAAKEAQDAQRKSVDAQTKSEEMQFQVTKDRKKVVEAQNEVEAAEGKVETEAMNEMKAKAEIAGKSVSEAKKAVSLAEEKLANLRTQAQKYQVDIAEHGYAELKAKQQLEEAAGSGSSSAAMKAEVLKEDGLQRILEQKADITGQAEEVAEKALLTKTEVAEAAYKNQKIADGIEDAAEATEMASEIRKAVLERRNQQTAMDAALSGLSLADEKAAEADHTVATARTTMDAATSTAALKRARASTETAPGRARLNAVRASAEAESRARKATADLKQAQEVSTEDRTEAKVKAIEQKKAAKSLQQASDKVEKLTLEQEEKDAEREKMMNDLSKELDANKSGLEAKFVKAQFALLKARAAKAVSQGQVEMLKKNAREDAEMEAAAKAEKKMDVSAKARQKKNEALLEAEIAKGEAQKQALLAEDRQFDVNYAAQVLRSDGDIRRATLKAYKAVDAAQQAARKEAKNEDAANAKAAEEVADAFFKVTDRALEEATASVDQTTAAMQKAAAEELEKEKIEKMARMKLRTLQQHSNADLTNADAREEATKLVDIAEQEKTSASLASAAAASAAKLAEADLLRKRGVQRSAKDSLAESVRHNMDTIRRLAEQDVDTAQRKKQEAEGQAAHSTNLSKKALEEADASYKSRLAALEKVGLLKAASRHEEHKEELERLREEVAAGTEDVSAQASAGEAKQHARAQALKNFMESERQEGVASAAAFDVKRHDATFLEEAKQAALSMAKRQEGAKQEEEAKDHLKELEKENNPAEADKAEKAAEKSGVPVNQTELGEAS